MSQLSLFEASSPDISQVSGEIRRLMTDKIVYYDAELGALSRALGIGDATGLPLPALKRAEKCTRQARDHLEKLHKAFELGAPPCAAPKDPTVLTLRSPRRLFHGYIRNRFTPLPAGRGDYYVISKKNAPPVSVRAFQRCLGEAGLLSVEALTALTNRAMEIMEDRVFDELCITGGVEQSLNLVGTVLSPQRDPHYFLLLSGRRAK
jgi:hypothetical protein